MSEHKLQVAVARLLDSSGLLWTAIPNGGKRSAITGAILKAEGVKAGVPDILVFTPFADPGQDESDRDLNEVRGQWCHGLAIELKNGKKGRTSEHQQTWLVRLELAGWKAVVCRDIDEVLEVLRDCYPHKFAT